MTLLIQRGGWRRTTILVGALPQTPEYLTKSEKP